jgi:Zn/Cd-binding protein ZinT
MNIKTGKDETVLYQFEGCRAELVEAGVRTVQYAFDKLRLTAW